MRGLVLRNGVWHFRREVPARLRSIIGKREWKESLGTGDLSAAQRRWQSVNERVERVFKEAEQGISNPTIAAYRAVEEWRQWRAQTPPRLDPEHGYDMDEDGYDYHITGLLEDDERGEKRLDAHTKAVLLALLKRNESGGQDDPPLSLVFSRYYAERHPLPRTKLEWEKARERFAAAVGGDMPVRSVTKGHVRAFKDSLIKTTARHGTTTLAPGSIQKMLAALRAVLSWAVGQGYIDVNPADGITHAGVKRAAVESKRMPYSAPDLRAIFAVERKGDANHWLPLLALWTGARLEELGQLRTADVRHDDGVDYLAIEGGNGKRVKTAGSWRRIPIHPELVRLGFLTFAEEQKSAGHERLFPELKANGGRQLTARWSKWWGRHARKVCGITDRSKTFHSFRHGWIDAAREVMPEEHRMAITGHSGGGVGRSYGSGVPLKVLAESMGKVRFAGVDQISV